MFAIVASTVGTVDFEQIRGLGVYAAALLFSLTVIDFFILPFAVGAFTGLTYRQLFSAFKAPALLGFTTGSLFITLPMIARATRDLLHARGASEQKAQEVADTLVPVSYSVPLVGTLGALLFVLFAAWFDGTSLGAGQYVSLAVSGVLSLFAEPRLALGLLLGQMGLPAESLNLYIAAEPLLKNVLQAVSVLSTTFFAVLAGAAVLGMARLHLRKAVVAVVVSVVALGAGTAGLSVALRPLADSGAGGYETLQRMQAPSLVPVRVYATAAEAPDPPPALPGESLLGTIQRRGVLRVGYAPQAFPFSYVNGDGDLVGYEVQRADDLAIMLESERVDFIPVDRQDFTAELDSGFIDTVMSAVQMTPGLYRDVDFSDIYQTLHIAVVAPDAEAGLYRTEEDYTRLEQRHDTRVAVEKGSYYAKLLRAANPAFTIVEVGAAQDFFDGDVADVLFVSAEEGSAWTLKYPHYEVVVPEFEQPPLYLAYPVKKGEVQWAGFLNNFVTVEKESGAQAQQYEYWVTGKTAVPKSTRWSVVRDVLHWVR